MENEETAEAQWAVSKQTLESEMEVPVLVALEVVAPALVVLLLAVLVDRPLVLVVDLHWRCPRSTEHAYCPGRPCGF